MNTRRRCFVPYWVVAALAFVVPARCQVPADPKMQQALAQAQAAAEKLRKEGKFEEAVAACEAFFRQYPDCGPAGRPVVYFVDLIFWRDLEKDAELRKKLAARGFQEFANVPDYYAYCASRLVQLYVWTEPSKAVEIANEAFAKLGDKIPDDYVGQSLRMFQVLSLRWANKLPEAIAAAKENVRWCPKLLADFEFQNALCGAVNGGGKPEEMVGAAKLFYVLCDFTEEAINRATKVVSEALTATQGPGVAIQFAKSQEDPKVANPLKDVELFDLGEGEKLLETAGKDPEARFNALLYLARIGDALALAKDQMRAAAGAPTALATAMKNLARCFKAKDLNLIRANRFLEFHRTGEGENPLKELEAELEREAKQ